MLRNTLHTMRSLGSLVEQPEHNQAKRKSRPVAPKKSKRPFAAPGHSYEPQATSGVHFFRRRMYIRGDRTKTSLTPSACNRTRLSNRGSRWSIELAYQMELPAHVLLTPGYSVIGKVSPVNADLIRYTARRLCENNDDHKCAINFSKIRLGRILKSWARACLEPYIFIPRMGRSWN